MKSFVSYRADSSFIRSFVQYVIMFSVSLTSEGAKIYSSSIAVADITELHIVANIDPSLGSG